MKQVLLKILLCSQLIILSSCLQSQVETTKIRAAIPVPSSELDSIPVRWSYESLHSARLNFKTSESFNADERNSINDMLTEWNQSGAAYSFFTIPSVVVPNKVYTSLSSYNDSEMGIYRLSSWFSEVGSDALAVTQFFAYRRNVGTSSEFLEIIHADILVNDANYDFATDGSMSKYDLPSVILHELGHVLGLKHSDSFSSIMYPSLGTGTMHRELRYLDQENIQDLYPDTPQVLSLTRNALSFSPKDEGALVRGLIEVLPSGRENIRLIP